MTCIKVPNMNPPRSYHSRGCAQHDLIWEPSMAAVWCSALGRDLELDID